MVTTLGTPFQYCNLDFFTIGDLSSSTLASIYLDCTECPSFPNASEPEVVEVETKANLLNNFTHYFGLHLFPMLTLSFGPFRFRFQYTKIY